MTDHYLNNWREHPTDVQTTIYICYCGYESSNRFDPHFERAT